ncbi:hypothetical protein ABTK15_21310, partial [Acinetobacter baumannii]
DDGNSGLASLTATGAGTQSISGTATFHFGNALSAVEITNDSTAKLVMSDVQVINPNPTTNLQLSAVDTSQFHYTSD